MLKSEAGTHQLPLREMINSFPYITLKNGGLDSNIGFLLKWNIKKKKVM